MSMVNPYEGTETASDTPKQYWVASYDFGDSLGKVIGVYTSEDKAMAGAVRFIQWQGWPTIADCCFTAFELDVTKSSV